MLYDHCVFRSSKIVGSNGESDCNLYHAEEKIAWLVSCHAILDGIVDVLSIVGSGLDDRLRHRETSKRAPRELLIGNTDPSHLAQESDCLRQT